MSREIPYQNKSKINFDGNKEGLKIKEAGLALGRLFVG